MINKIKRNKKITTIMNTIGSVIATIFIIAAIVLLKLASSGASQSANYLNTQEYNELTGGFEILGGSSFYGASTFAAVVAFLLLAVAIIFLIVFLVPTIHGIILWKKTDRYLARGESVYLHTAIIDSIIKLVFNGVPAIWLASTLVDSWDAPTGCIEVYLIIICIIEVYTLINAWKEKKNYGNYAS